MKKMWDRGWMILIACVVVTAMSVTSAKAQGSVPLQVFYDELQPYGTWMDYGNYGYVWMPRVSQGFTPYATNGYWINTEYGNTWVSDYSWGWAPFHYGRWLFDDFYGWLWVPDTQWAPAWVAWRSGGGYYGWAPLMPGLGMNMTFAYYNRIPHHYWSFVPYHYITYRNVYRHCVSRPTVVNVYNQTTIITNNYTDNRRRTYFTGPTRSDMEHRSGGRVTVHHISDSDRPGRTEVSDRTANFYRPEVDNSRDSRVKSIPATYVRRDGSGNVEQVETRRGRNADLPATPSQDNFDRNTRGGQRDYTVDRSEQRRLETNPNVQRRDFQPAQQTAPSVNEMPSRTYQPLHRERQPVVRDQYDAPPVQRSHPSRDVQQRNFEQPQQQMQRQNTMPQQGGVQRDHSSFEQYRSRSSAGQSQPAQIRRNDSGESHRQPTRGSSVQPEFRKRN